jgi:3-hydroxyisobutyrate dehydrogenase-like beta-hydroxyacid dehydrogenase
MAASRFTNVGCKLSLMQKDLKLAINMSDSVDQPLHVGSAVNEVVTNTVVDNFMHSIVLVIVFLQACLLAPYGCC